MKFLHRRSRFNNIICGYRIYVPCAGTGPTSTSLPQLHFEDHYDSHTHVPRASRNTIHATRIVTILSPQWCVENSVFPGKYPVRAPVRKAEKRNCFAYHIQSLSLGNQASQAKPSHSGTHHPLTHSTDTSLKRLPFTHMDIQSIFDLRLSPVKESQAGRFRSGYYDELSLTSPL